MENCSIPVQWSGGEKHLITILLRKALSETIYILEELRERGFYEIKMSKHWLKREQIGLDVKSEIFFTISQLSFVVESSVS